MNKNKVMLLAVVFLAFFLRFFRLDSFPPGLYSDEAALGYNAYSILKTGKDEYGRFLPLTLQSFGDYKPPLSAYMMIPFIYFFGLNEFSLRFPFAFFGGLAIVLIYYLALEVFRKNEKKQLIALLGAFLLAISPWHLSQSRSAMLVGLEVFFNALGVFLFFKGLKKNYRFFFSSLSFSLAIYAYYGSRVTVPLLALSLVIIFRKEFFSKARNIIFFILGFLLLVPLFWAIFQNPETLLGRARYMSIFYDKNIYGQLWQASTVDGQQHVPVPISRLFHNKPFYYAKDIFRRWWQHFEWGFLFIKGDVVPPFYMPRMGLVYIIEWPFILTGLYWLFRERSRHLVALLLWFLLAPVTAALTFMTPAANRSFNMIFPLSIISAFGLVKFLVNNHHWRWRRLIIFSYALCLIYYLYSYYYIIPREISDKWHYGRRQMVEKIVKLQNNYEKVVVTGEGGPAYIFLLFYQQYDPNKYRATMRVDPYINELGWGHIFGFANYDIPREFSWNEIEKKEGVLYVAYKEKVPDTWQEPVEGRQLKVNILDKIYFPNAKVAYKIFDLQPVD